MMAVEPHRSNVFAYWGEPVVTLSTHMDTVPPFYASREDDEFIWGRGACDTKGIIASMIKAVEGLLAAGENGLRAAVRGRRGAQQRGRVLCRAGIRAAAATLLTASRRRINWRWGRRARCGLRLSPAGRWRIRRIRSWANRRLRNCWMRWSEIRKIELPVDHDSGREHAEYRDHYRRSGAERDSGSCDGGDFYPPGGRRKFDARGHGGACWPCQMCYSPLFWSTPRTSTGWRGGGKCCIPRVDWVFASHPHLLLLVVLLLLCIEHVHSRPRRYYETTQ